MSAMSPIDNELMSSVKERRLEAAANALARGANPSLAVDGFSVLSEALMRADAPMARLLLGAGAELEWEGMPRTPLSIAIIVGSEPCFEALLEAGAPLEGASGRGMTPLMEALMSGSGRLAFAEELARRGADMEARDPDGETPLFYAMASKSVEAVELALRWGADPLALDFQGANVAERAREAGAGAEWLALAGPLLIAAIERRMLAEAGSPAPRSGRGSSL